MTTITVLHNGSRRLSKAITYKSASEASIASYDNAKTFLVEQEAVEDIEGFSALLCTLQSDTHRLIIRGTPHPDTDITKPVRRKTHFPNTASVNEAPFQDLPQPWLMLDIDKLKLP